MVGFGGRVVFRASSHTRLVCRASSSRPSLYSPIVRYSHQDHRDERAPSTAEEFKRVAEEKMREAEQGVAGQTVEKTYEWTEEAVSADPNIESVKKRYKEHEENADHCSRSDNGGGPSNTLTGS